MILRSVADDRTIQPRVEARERSGVRSDKVLALALSLLAQAIILAREGVSQLAVELLNPASQTTQKEQWLLLRSLCADLEAELGTDGFAAGWERNQAVNLETVFKELLNSAEIARSAPRQITGCPSAERLSKRELEVLRLVAEGLSNAEIAQTLFISLGTVKVHTRNIYSKLDVSNRTLAVVQAQRLNLL